jgi:hypothetical protein
VKARLTNGCHQSYAMPCHQSKPRAMPSIQKKTNKYRFYDAIIIMTNDYIKYEYWMINPNMLGRRDGCLDLLHNLLHVSANLMHNVHKIVWCKFLQIWCKFLALTISIWKYKN